MKDIAVLVEAMRRQYLRLFRDPPNDLECQLWIDDAIAWLEDHVFPLLTEFIDSDTFRTNALKPFRVLKPDSRTSERQCLDKVRKSQLELAEIIAGICKVKEIRDEIEDGPQELARRELEAAEQPNLRNGNIAQTRELTRAKPWQVQSEIDRLVERCREDPVDFKKYFPVDTRRGINAAIFRTSPFAPFLTKSIHSEIDERQDCLDEFVREIEQVRELLGSKVLCQKPELNAAVKKASNAIDRLAKQLQSAQYKATSHAYATVTLAFAAFGSEPSPDDAFPMIRCNIAERLNWLPFSPERIRGGGKACRRRLSARPGAALEQLYEHLSLIMANPQDWKIDPEDFDTAKLQIRSTDGCAIWAGNPITLPPAQFETLRWLAERTKAVRGTQSSDVADFNEWSSQNLTRHSLSQRISKLKKRLNEDESTQALASMIVANAGRYALSLDLVEISIR